MSSSPPQPKPEGVLIKDALARRRLSVRKAAKIAQISETRWRQIVSGYQTVAGQLHVDVIGPTDTVARMAQAAGVSPDELREAGRADAADELLRLIDEARASQLPDELGGLQPWQQEVILNVLNERPRSRREKGAILKRLAEKLMAADSESAGDAPEEPHEQSRGA